MQSAERPFSIDDREVDGKRILVTGGTSGMGEAFVSRVTAGGGSVATTARTPLPDAQEPKLFVQADVATAAGVQGVVDRLLTDWSGIDIQAREMT
jgi:NAD(P)-dependent dehydrogenase (short-subunit alcohol dehydrogenase family)